MTEIVRALQALAIVIVLGIISHDLIAISTRLGTIADIEIVQAKALMVIAEELQKS